MRNKALNSSEERVYEGKRGDERYRTGEFAAQVFRKKILQEDGEACERSKREQTECKKRETLAEENIPFHDIKLVHGISEKTHGEEIEIARGIEVVSLHGDKVKLTY